MLVRNNTKRESDITTDQATEWLKRNPHRTSEHMTGKLAPDAVICKLRRSTNNACAKPHPDTLMDSAGRRMNPTAARYTKTIRSIELKLKDAKVVTHADFDGYSTPIIVKMVRQLRDKGCDVLTLTRLNKAVGWCLASTVFDNEPTEVDSHVES